MSPRPPLSVRKGLPGALRSVGGACFRDVSWYCITAVSSARLSPFSLRQPVPGPRDAQLSAQAFRLQLCFGGTAARRAPLSPVIMHVRMHDLGVQGQLKTTRVPLPPTLRASLPGPAPLGRRLMGAWRICVRQQQQHARRACSASRRVNPHSLRAQIVREFLSPCLQTSSFSVLLRHFFRSPLRIEELFKGILYPAAVKEQV